MVETFWKNVKEMLEIQEISPTKLSRHIGKSDNYISQCIKEQRSPVLEVIVGIGEFFGVEPFDLTKRGTAEKFYLDNLKNKIETYTEMLKQAEGRKR